MRSESSEGTSLEYLQAPPHQPTPPFSHLTLRKPCFPLDPDRQHFYLPIKGVALSLCLFHFPYRTGHQALLFLPQTKKVFKSGFSFLSQLLLSFSTSGVWRAS